MRKSGFSPDPEAAGGSFFCRTAFFRDENARRYKKKKAAHSAAIYKIGTEITLRRLLLLRSMKRKEAKGVKGKGTQGQALDLLVLPR